MIVCRNKCIYRKRYYLRNLLLKFASAIIQENNVFAFQTTFLNVGKTIINFKSNF